LVAELCFASAASAASTQDRVRICRFVSKKCRQLVDSQVHSLRANLKSLSTRDATLALQLHFPCLQRLSFDRAAPSESSHLLEQLASNQPQLLSHLQELDLSCCQVGCACNRQSAAQHEQEQDYVA
jgi:hypothetical protein